ncbi:MAG: membrane dipeptidase [Myxococcaceae bacterium]|nr:membrane dipeptidase [Myxococcaceae bacterium]
MIDIHQLHARCPVADGHADSLMWNRDLNEKSDKGHVDFPRLKEAGVKIQCFTVVTRGFPLIDMFSAFARRQNWPKEARQGEWNRCQFQVNHLHALCGRSNGAAAVAGSRTDLESNLSAGRLSAVLGIEGGHALEGQVERVRALHQQGVRFLGLTHLTNNELGGSSYPFMGDRGLTPLGQQVLDEMAACGMLVDTAHASHHTLEDVLAHPTARPFCSHGGVNGAKKSWRNLPDWALKKIADKGGVVGIIFATVYVGGNTWDHVARHIEHAVNVMGEDAVSLGSDFDGFVPLPKGMRDVRDLYQLTETLVRRGLTEARIEKILGGNMKRLFTETLG